MAHEESIYCPRSLAQIFPNFFISPEERRTLLVRGVYCDRKGNEFGGNYYDRLKDEASGEILTIKPGLFTIQWGATSCYALDRKRDYLETFCITRVRFTFDSA